MNISFIERNKMPASSQPQFDTENSTKTRNFKIKNSLALVCVRFGSARNVKFKSIVSGLEYNYYFFFFHSHVGQKESTTQSNPVRFEIYKKKNKKKFYIVIIS
jgi:hypothetical protein